MGTNATPKQDPWATKRDGWVKTRLDDEVTVCVKLGLDISLDDRGMTRRRVVVKAVLIEADEVTAETLRKVQPARIHGAIALNIQEVGPGTLAGEPEWMLQLFGTDSDDATTLKDLRSRPTMKARRTKRKALGRPDGLNPDRFYRQFAAAYRSAVAQTNRPAVLLADENDVPTETVRRWTKEARRRGFLAPGTKGKAG